MTILDWLWPPRSRPGSCKIEEKKASIAETQRAREATQPILDEARRRDEQRANRLRARAEVAKRIVARESLLLGFEGGLASIGNDLAGNPEKK